MHYAHAVKFDREGRREPGGECKGDAIDGKVLEEQERGSVEEAVESGNIEAEVGKNGERVEEP